MSASHSGEPTGRPTLSARRSARMVVHPGHERRRDRPRPDLGPLGRLVKQVKVERIIGCLQKRRLPAVAALRNMVRNAGQNGPRQPRHQQRSEPHGSRQPDGDMLLRIPMRRRDRRSDCRSLGVK